MRQNEWVGKRNSARQNCQMRGEMRFLDGRAPIETTIVDISASGCRIELDANFEVPEDFDLFIPSRSETKIAKIRRQDGVKLGVAFLKSRLDDPLVMHTLLQRVGRLEQGYSEIKSFRGLEAPRQANAQAPDASRDAEAGPLVEHRLKALAEGLAELRNNFDGLAKAPSHASVDLIADRANEAAADIAGLKDELANLARSMRGLASAPDAESSDHAANIAALKGEMTRLSVAMRNMAAELPKTAQPGATKAPAGPSDAELKQWAAMKADIAQLRAAIEVQQGSASTPLALARAEEFALMRSEIAQLRADLETARAAALAPSAPGQTELDDLRAEIATLRDSFAASRNDLALSLHAVAGQDRSRVHEELAGMRENLFREIAGIKSDIGALTTVSASLGEEHARTRNVAAEVVELKQEMAALGGAMREITSKAYADAPKFSADLAHMKAEMLKLSAAMNGMAAELPRLQSAAPPGAPSFAEWPQALKINADMERLQAVVAALQAAVEDDGDEREHTREIVAEVMGMKQEMATLGGAMREITSKAYADAPKFSADLAHLKAEMLMLSAAMNGMAAELPRLQSAAPPGAPSFAGLPQAAKINADIEGLQAVVAALKAAVEDDGDEREHTREIVAEVMGMKQEMATLSQSMREITAKAYAEAPTFSADLAHMKAEMLTLSASMREMAVELPHVRAAAAAAADASEVAKLQAEFARLRDALKTMPPAVVPDAHLHAVEDLKLEFDLLRDNLRSAKSTVADADLAKLRDDVARLREAVQSWLSEAAAEADKLATLQQDIEQLRGVAAPLMAPAREVSELRGSVQALIVIVAQSLGQPRNAA